MTAGLVIDRGVECPLSDGVVLRSDVYRPAGRGKYPVLLERTPYDRSNYMMSGTPLDPLRAARSGFAVVIQDTRGRFESGGEFYPFVNEANDGRRSVEWCASQSWSNGQVGMYGNSYMGATCWQAALAKPQPLVTMVPAQASSDYYEGRSYRGGAFEIGSLLTTVVLGLLPGSLKRSDGGSQAGLLREARALLADLEGTASRLPLVSLRETVLGTAAPYFFDWMEHYRDDEYWRTISVEPHYPDIRLPVLHLTSWFDSFLVGALRNYQGMTSAGARDQVLVVGPWTHHVPMAALLGSARVGDMDCGLASMLDFDALQLGWFDSLFRDGRPPTRQPPVRYFVMGSNMWRSGDTWPPPTETVRLYLSSRYAANGLAGGGHLSRSVPPASSSESDTYLYDPEDPVPTRGGAHVLSPNAYPPGSWDQREIERREDVLVYTSEPLGEDLEIVGWIVAFLFVVSTAPSTDFTVKLVDVHASGRAMNVCDGIQRLGQDSSQPYVAGEPCEVRVGMDATAHLFQRDHMIRVEISSSNFPRFDRNLNVAEPPFLGTVAQRARQRVFHSARWPSAVEMPARLAD